jgi:tetratricopeptide (TPR) repeat protein
VGQVNVASSDNRSQVHTLLLRIGLLSTALVLFTRAYDLWISGQPSLYPLSLILSFAAWGFGAFLAILALRRETGPRSAWLVLIGLIYAFLCSAYIHWRNAHPLITPHTDNQMIAEYAVQVLRRGINPYTWDFSDFRRVFHDLLDFTAFLDGSIQHRVTYPALPTLLLYALDSIGLGYAKLTSVAAHVVLLVLLFVGSPPPFRPVILLPLFVFREFSSFPLAGLQDVFWCALILGMILAWNRPRLRAVLFGLACSYRQQPWLIAPFLVIQLWHEGGPLRARLLRVGDFAATSAGVFVVINLPFILWDPVAWLLGTWEPSFASFGVWSQGIGVLTQFGLVSWTRAFCTILQLSFYASALVLYWRHPRSMQNAIWVVPAFFFWLYYRALTNYWIYWIPPLLLVVARADEPRSPLERIPERRQVSWKPTAGIIGAIAVADVVFASVLLFRQAPISANYRLPIQTSSVLDNPLVTRIELDLTNHSDETLAPRFSVQREQPYPWLIENGPETLQPGQSGIYTIAAGYPAVAFPASEGAQIVITDGSGDYSLRKVLDIPSDPTVRDPDRIVNPQYYFWADTNQIPTGWELDVSPQGSGMVQMDLIDGRDALVLRPTTPGRSGYLRLSQKITFPATFDIWVYPTAPVSAPEQGVGYGLEFFDGVDRLWVLFGNAKGQGFLDKYSAYVSMPAPLNEWSVQHVALDELYHAVGLPLPPATLRAQNDLSFQARQVEVSLLLLSDGSENNRGIFGPIEQPTVQQVGSTDYLDQALQDPSGYYVGLGNDYTDQRNYQLALDAYETALAYEPDNAEACYGLAIAYSGLGKQENAQAALEECRGHGYPQLELFGADAFFDLAESLFWQGDWHEAIAAYEKALDLGYRKPFMAYKGMGWAYFALGLYQDARLNFELASRSVLDPVGDAVHLADAQTGLGWILLSENRCEEAVPLFERALRLAPGLSHAQQGLDSCRQGR